MDNPICARDPDMVDLSESNAAKTQSRSRCDMAGAQPRCKDGESGVEVGYKSKEEQAPVPELMQQVKSELSGTDDGFPNAKWDLQQSRGSSPSASKAAIMGLHEVLDYSIWCLYCFCGGCGCNPRQGHCKCTWECVCGHALMEGAPWCVDSCCSCVHHWLCCAYISEFPPQEGSPCCILAGDACLDYCPVHRKYPAGKVKELAKHVEGSGFTGDHPPPPSEFQSARQSNNACLCCCCGCVQCGIPDCSSHTSCCCSRFECNLSLREECCSCLLTCCWLSGQCWLPPEFAHNPVCACLGLRLRKPFIKDAPHPNSIR